jgi:anaerobic selenocysteine-containing dehydrogenase
MQTTKKDIYCFICPSHCALKATFDENGKMIKAVADSRSGQHCDICDCAKGPNTIPEAHSHGQRLQFPMKRAGERGRNQWIRITWDEALDTIAEKMKFYRDTYGPESIAMVLGEPKSMDYAFAQRFATYLETTTSRRATIAGCKPVMPTSSALARCTSSAIRITIRNASSFGAPTRKIPAAISVASRRKMWHAHSKMAPS